MLLSAMCFFLNLFCLKIIDGIGFHSHVVLELFSGEVITIFNKVKPYD